MTYQAVLFDLDGTLLDTLEDLANAGNRALARLGLPTHHKDAYRRFVGSGVSALAERMLPPDVRGTARAGEALAAFKEEYAKNWRERTRLYPGIADLLNGLVARKIPACVLSNKPHDFTLLCVRHFLADWPFASVLGHREGVAKKPDPAGALETARFLHLAPAQILYVGDSDVDMQTAHNAGMIPAGALWGFRSAEELRQAGAAVLVADPQELLRFIDAA